eukprot:CAMPEP_0118930908 /NCGR_PEP_ID=MMETSP1169-20130426/7436_1 /TAXON_ID=36882 /ORGANISM="Pyramimonas obovata, Strain CCMP722" /LENGTH=81 /DNA_ID=CAMNT_0006873337 /DNA_START=178 /DNA_END=420 /DNA_ORIENTATION=+
MGETQNPNRRSALTVSFEMQESNANRDIRGLSMPLRYGGYAVGVTGYVALTLDSGRTWSPINTGTNVDFYSTSFASINTGW